MNAPKFSVKTLVTFLVGAAITVGTLSACNTIAGAGKDIKSTGKAIERTADDHK